MSIHSWDPLTISQSTDAEIFAAAQKREIKNILKSYVGMYDSFCELIQNAMDAVDKRASIENMEDYTRKLWLTVDLADNSFSITDNGIGFNQKELETFLAPNISFKDDGKTRGNKGVGATYIGYGFDYLQFATKGNGHVFSGELKSGRSWVEDYKGIVTRPTVVAAPCASPEFSQIDRGSTFKLRFGGEHTRPKDLSWYTATKPEQWLYLLLLKTPLGSIDYLGGPAKQIKFDLKVIKKSGEFEILTDQDAKYIFPHSKINGSVNLKEVLQSQQRLIAAGNDASNIPKRFLKANGIYEFFSTEELLALRPNDSEFSHLINQYNVEAYGYFTYSTAVWDQFNDTLAKLRKGFRVLKGGLQMANNKMTQGELVAIPLTSNIGYQNQCHIIVHFSNADPDLGRKGFQPELKEVAEQISVSIVNRFKRWKSLLKSDSGAKPVITKELELFEWVNNQVLHEKDFPLVIKNKSFFAPVNEISITSEPQSEQDVIVLFNQLLAGGVIRGLKLLATSQVMQYDAVFKYVVREPITNHVFDKSENPLGVAELHHIGEIVSPPKILEYKYNLDALIQEFESETKTEKDIHLAVAWEMGSEWKKKYTITSFLDLDNLHQRDYHGLTHVLDSHTSKFHVIVLKELVEYLNDVDGSQKFQREAYSEELFTQDF